MNSHFCGSSEHDVSRRAFLRTLGAGTGLAASGIGAATVIDLAADHLVIAVARNAERLEQVVAASRPGAVIAVAVDLTDFAAVAEAVADLQPGGAALPSYIEQLERSAIQRALEENRWNKTRTAAQLGITFRALRYKLKKLGME